MRIYSSVLEAVKETEREIFEMGIVANTPTVQDLDVRDNPDYESKELLGYGYAITGFNDVDQIFNFFFEDSVKKKEVIDYSQAELSDRLSFSPQNPGTSWKYRKDYWEKFLHDGRFSYTYSERIGKQLYNVIKELTANPESRQCVSTIYDQHQDLENWGGRKRIPCSMYYHFLKRKISGNYRLFLIYTMRSNDFYTHFPVDVWVAINLGVAIGDLVEAPLFSFTHFISSLHAFQKDFNKRRIF